MHTYAMTRLLCLLVVPGLGLRPGEEEMPRFFAESPIRLQCDLSAKMGPYTCNAEDRMKTKDLHSMQDGLKYFDRRLGCFLEAVWSKVREINSWEDIYRMYAGVSSSTDLDDTALQQFKEKVIELNISKSEGLKVQSGGEISTSLSTEPEKLWTAFYHLHPKSSPGGKTPVMRVYIHASTAMHGLAIVENILDYCSADPSHGIESLKIAGPGSIRDDNIVVYLTNSAKLNDLVKTLAPLGEEFFESTLPALVEPIQPGVGFADEPRFNRKISFGSFYSKIIFKALKSEKVFKERNDKEDVRYLKEVWRGLKDSNLKLDPCNHAKLSPRCECVSWITHACEHWKCLSA